METADGGHLKTPENHTDCNINGEKSRTDNCRRSVFFTRFRNKPIVMDWKHNEPVILASDWSETILEKRLMC